MLFFRVTPTGGSPSSIDGVKVLTGEVEPTSTLGTNGDIYLQTGNEGALLHFDEDFTDEGGTVWNVNGTPTISADQSKFGGNSLYLDGSSYIQSDINADVFNFANNDFTISCWIYPTTTGRKAVFAMSSDQKIATDILYGQGSANLWLSSTGNSWNILQSDGSGANTGQGTIPININEWTHIAYVRNGANVRMYVNGQIARDVTLSSADISVNWSGNDGFRIGCLGNGSYKYTGYIDEFIVVNGAALWEDAFTPPTEPMTLPVICKKVFRKIDNEWVKTKGTNIDELGSFENPYGGNLKVLNGTATPSSDLGNDGDIYLKAENDVITSAYQKVNGEWQSLINSPINEKTIVEPMSVYSGSDAPTSILGKNNDLYLRNINNTLLPQIKINGSWQDLANTSIEDIFFAKPIPAGIYGYTKLSYIKSDGSAWINSNLRFTTDTKFEIKGRWTTTSLNDEFFFGIWESAKESELGYENGSLIYLIGGTGKYQSFTPDTNSHVISSDVNGIYVDGVSVGTPTWSNVSTAYDIPIFARSVAGTINKIASHFELEYCKIWQGGTLIRDFVPCKRNYDNAIGLYDKVNDKFYQNNGTGEIIAGPVVAGGEAITYKNYVHFTDGIGFTLPFTINADYKITVVFNDTVYKLGNAIIDNTYGSNYLRFGVYNQTSGDGYYSSRGSQVGFWGTWSSGTHIFICNNGNNHSVFDGVEVASYSPTTLASAKISLGGGDIHGEEQRTSPDTYISRFKIESLSTGDVICDLRPAIQGQSTHCMYDIVNDIAYTSSGLEAVDDIV